LGIKEKKKKKERRHEKQEEKEKEGKKIGGGGIYIGDFSMTHECYPYQNKVKNTN
jgi:DNA invertase Pin-like site-specific DNA recombinase